MSFNDQGGVDHNVKAPIPPYNPPRVRLPDGRMVTAIEPYVFREYPKAALKRATKDDIDTVLRNAENFDERRNVMRYVRRPPRLGELIPLKDPGEPAGRGIHECRGRNGVLCDVSRYREDRDRIGCRSRDLGRPGISGVHQVEGRAQGRHQAGWGDLRRSTRSAPICCDEPRRSVSKWTSAGRTTTCALP